jgi:hypothetical protein
VEEDIYPNIAHHLACLWQCCGNVSALIGVSMDDVLETNIAKLRLRYPHGYSDSAAFTRADEKPVRVPHSAAEGNC